MKFNLKLSRRETILFSSLATLLPIVVGLVLWFFRLPDQFAIYLDNDARPDAWGSMLPAILVPPLVMLVVQWICLYATYRDPGNRDQNRKVLSLTAWIIPILSNLTSYMTYALAMGANYSVAAYVQLFLGLLFALIGNYLPKTQPNATIGIKIPWVYTSRHNWRATHRFGGYCWMIGGLVMALAAFIPSKYTEQTVLIILLVLVVLPIGFSFIYYLRQKANNDPLHHLPKIGKGCMLALVLLIVFVVIVLFTGNLTYVFHEDHMTIEASYYTDYTVYYDRIESIEYHPGNVEGTRIGGWGSLRLLMGYFNSEELETYTRYTYFNPEACILLTMPDRLLVISGRDAAETSQLYQDLLSRIPQ